VRSDKGFRFWEEEAEEEGLEFGLSHIEFRGVAKGASPAVALWLRR